MPRYYITEPHPTVKTNSYVHAGRGGAGNIFKAPTTTPAAGVPTSPGATAPAKSSSSGRFYSGRGGAGNSHAASERTALSFDDEYGAAVAHDAAAGGHFGRGGAGNSFMPAAASKSHKNGDDASLRRDSASTNGSTRSGFWGRLSSSSLGHR